MLSFLQQSSVSQEESPRGAGEVEQHHQHPLHRHPQEGKNGSLSTPPTSEVRLVYQCCVNMNNIVILWQEMSHKDLETIENIKWDPPYDPASGWKKSSINVKNYGRMIHSSKVRFRFLHCQVIATKQPFYNCAGQKVSKSAVYLWSPTKTKTPMTHPTAR